MKQICIIALFGIILMLGFVTGCSVDNPSEIAAGGALPAEVQKAIDSGEVANVVLTNTRAVTGTVSGDPVLYPSNYPDNPNAMYIEDRVKRDTPAIRIKLTLNTSNSYFDTYFFYIGSSPAVIVRSTDYPNVFNPNTIAAFIDRDQSNQTYSVLVYCLKKTGYLLVTGSYSYNVKFWFGTSLDCSITNWWAPDYSKWTGPTECKTVSMKDVQGLDVSYWVYAAGCWQEDNNGFASGCTDESSGFTRLTASPNNITLFREYPNADKIGVAYRIWNISTAANDGWSVWGLGEIDRSGALRRRISATVANGVFGMQASLYMC
jgi:hypothetical protein